MPSARRTLPRLAIAACCGSLLLGAATGCTTTQEKAARHQAEAERVREAREKRQQRRKNDKSKEKHGKEGNAR